MMLILLLENGIFHLDVGWISFPLQLAMRYPLVCFLCFKLYKQQTSLKSRKIKSFGHSSENPILPQTFNHKGPVVCLQGCT